MIRAFDLPNTFIIFRAFKTLSLVIRKRASFLLFDCSGRPLCTNYSLPSYSSSNYGYQSTIRQRVKKIEGAPIRKHRLDIAAGQSEYGRAHLSFCSQPHQSRSLGFYLLRESWQKSTTRTKSCTTLKKSCITLTSSI